MALLHSTFGIAARATASNRAQRALDRLVIRLNLLRGIGGDFGVVGTSGVFADLKPGSVIFDIGANRGQFAQAAIASVKDVKLHCFEPSAASFRDLELSVGSLARLNHCALGHEVGSLTLYSDAVGSEMASLYNRDLAHIGKAMSIEETVAVSTVDEYCATHSIAHIDLLKIDVEGAEMDVLRGTTGMLGRRAIGCLIFEFGGTHLDSRVTLRDFYNFLQQHGAKRIGRMTPTGWIAPADHYSESIDTYQAANYVAWF